MMQDDDDNDDPMILNITAKNHTSERSIVPWTVIFFEKNTIFSGGGICEEDLIKVWTPFQISLQFIPAAAVRVD